MNDTKISEVFNPETKILKVKIVKGNTEKKEYYFDHSFTIGRSEDCSIQINEGSISRLHIEVVLENTKWWIIDKQSSNGTFLNGSKIEKTEIKNSTSIELAKNSSIVLFTFESPEDPSQSESSKIKSISGYIQHYFDESKSEQDMGDHTRLMHAAYEIVKRKHSIKYKKLIFIIGLIAAIAAAYSIFQHIKESKQKILAENIFYQMKSLELEISSLKNRFADNNNVAVRDALQKFDERHKQLENNYDKLIDELGIYNKNETDKLIIRTARIFGECELNVPRDFISEVKMYVRKWQSNDRLASAIQRAELNNYPQIIVDDFVLQHMAPQFFYLALQESDFRDQVVGPETKYGIAKGIWQFIPQTAVKYGLSIGPLAGVRVYDPRDDRYNFIKATKAAAKYINDIYDSDAQASGLLVVASYNWGEYNIIDLIRKLPENPHDRNFWNLFKKYKDIIPKETYNYVLNIFSAVVICENPRLFGFDFDNPLKASLQNINIQ